MVGDRENYQPPAAVTMRSRSLFFARGEKLPATAEDPDYFALSADFFGTMPKTVLSDSTSLREFSPKLEKPCSKITMKQNVEAMKRMNQKADRMSAMTLSIVSSS
jgi:hypothetical protein